MKYTIRISLLLAALATLGACGQKGPLQLPSEAPASQEAPAQEAEQAQGS